MQSMIIPLKR